MKIIAAVAVALVAAAAIAAGNLASGSSKPGPRDTVIAWTTALSKRNFYDACSYYSENVLGHSRTVDPDLGSITYSATRWCAVGLEGSEGFSLILAGQPVFDRFQVAAKPKPGAHHKLVYRVKYYQGYINVSVQRDKHGDWKIVGIS